MDPVLAFALGFLHPMTGIDHVIPMVALGIWAGRLGSRAAIGLALLFPACMALGALAAFLGVPMPPVEAGIAASALVLGVLVMTAARLPPLAAAALVGVFAIFH